jgi:choice-of-anchor B domain-containing protein
VDVADMPVDFQETARYTGIASAHNLIINEDTGFGYAVGTGRSAEGCGGQLHMIDLHDPLNPTFAGCFNDPNSGGTHDAQCVIYHGSDNDYNGKEICLNSNGRSFLIADVTDKSNPVTVANATYPNTAYTHQGWLSEDHNYFYMNDELDEMNKIFDRTRTLVWDVSDLDDPLLVKEVFLSNGASDHNLFVKGNFVYESNYNAGLVILDITDPTNPVEVGHFDTAPNAENIYGFAGSWGNYPFFESGIIAVSSKTEGLFLVRKREVDL